MATSMDADDTVTTSDGDLKYREWTIALGVTTGVFFATTLVLSCILFIVVCRKIAKLRKEREARVTGVMEGMTSPHWIDRTNLNDMLSQERDNPDKQPQNIWSISTQTFERNQALQVSTTPMATSPITVPAQTTAGNNANTNDGIISSGEAKFSGETDDGERTTSMTGSPTIVTGGRQNVKPNRTAPPPPKAQKKSKGQNGMTAAPNDAQYHDPTPYVYPVHKLKQKLKQKQKDSKAPTGGNQSHEYAQPHAHLQVHDVDKQTSVTGNVKKHEYRPIDPKLKQPTGQYQDLMVNGLPRGQSLPTTSTFATLDS